jgi:1-acyl-sn-glycerol-3-phosphate acyltransferase
MYYLGRFIGWILFWTLIKPLRFIYGRKKCEYLGLENLQELKGESFFVASNHIKPRNKFLRFVSFPYDAFLARKMLLTVDFYATALTSYDSPVRPKDKLGKLFVTHVKEQLSKGIIMSSDLIPLNRKSSDSETFQILTARVRSIPTAIGIFPEGTWFRGFRSKRKMYNGSQVLSKRYNLPIVPIFINAYNMNQPIQIIVGKPILPGANENIGDKLRELYQLLMNRDTVQKEFV